MATRRKFNLDKETAKSVSRSVADAEGDAIGEGGALDKLVWARAAVARLYDADPMAYLAFVRDAPLAFMSRVIEDHIRQRKTGPTQAQLGSDWYVDRVAQEHGVELREIVQYTNAEGERTTKLRKKVLFGEIDLIVSAQKARIRGLITSVRQWQATQRQMRLAGLDRADSEVGDLDDRVA